MDRWLPKGNVPSSAEGAFERFFTAAIATIITIIFSWTMLDKINEEKKEDEDEPERHRLGRPISSPLSQSSSFVSFSSSPLGSPAVGVALTRPINPGVRSQLFGQHNESMSQRSVSLSHIDSRSHFTPGGFGFQVRTLNTIMRVPVDLPLCGDNPTDVTCVENTKISNIGEACGISVDSSEVVVPRWFALDSNGGRQFFYCSIDRTSPGAGLRDEAHAHEPAITVNRSVALSQAAGKLNSHTEWRLSCQDIENFTASSRNNSNDSSLEYMQSDVVDITDSSLEEAGNFGVENNSDSFFNLSNECSDDNSKEDYQDIVDEGNYQQIHSPNNTTDSNNFNNEQGDDFIVSSDGTYYDHGYDFDNDDVQPRELDSDEELFCCSILEPIIEEDSEEMTSSEGDSSRSEKSLYSFRNAKIPYDLDFDEKKRELIPEENIFAPRPDYSVDDSTLLWQETRPIVSSAILSEQNNEVPGQSCASDHKSRIPDPENLDDRLQNINTVLASDPDDSAAVVSEEGGIFTCRGAQLDGVHAQFLVPADQVNSEEECVLPTEYIRYFGSSVDQISCNHVNEYTQQDIAKDLFRDDLNQAGENKSVENSDEDFVFANAAGNQFLSRHFMQTFSTRVEVEDSNSESDESVQTVISRQVSREIDGSPVHSQGLTSGLRPVPGNTKRPISDGILYSSNLWKNEEAAEDSYRWRNFSEGGGVVFGEEVIDGRKEADLIQGRSEFNSLPYRSYTTQDLNSLTDTNIDFKLSNRFTSTRKQEPTPTNEFENADLYGGYFNPHLRSQDKYGNTSVDLGLDRGRQLFESTEEAEQRYDVNYAKQNYTLDSQDAFVTSAEEEQVGSVHFLHEVSNNSSDSQFLYSHFSREDNDKDSMDNINSFVSYIPRNESRNDDYFPGNEIRIDDYIPGNEIRIDDFIQGNEIRIDDYVSRSERKIDDMSEKREADEEEEEEWEEEVVETFVIPLSPERTEMRTMQNMKDLLDQRNAERRSDLFPRDEEEGSDEEEYQSSCTTTMIEVEGHGALGFKGEEDVTSGYRGQSSALARTDRELKERLGFKLNLDEYKTEDYMTRSGWPVVTLVERERVYIEEDGCDEDSYGENVDTFREMREVYADDGFGSGMLRGPDTGDLDEEERVEENEEVENEIETITVTTYPVRKEEMQSFKSSLFTLPQRVSQLPVDQSSVVTTRMSQFQPSSSREKYAMFEFGDIKPSELKIPSPPEVYSTEALSLLSRSEEPTNIPRATTDVYSPGLTTLRRHDESGSQGISILTIGSREKQLKDSNASVSNVPSRSESVSNVPSRSESVSNVPSRSESVSNYDDFVRHISEDDDEPVSPGDSFTSLTPSPRGTILSGNVTTSNSKQDVFMFPTYEQTSRESTRSPRFVFKDSFNDVKVEKDIQIEHRHEEDEYGNQKTPFVKKPRFVRTSTAQNEVELLSFKPGVRKLDSGSHYDESTSILNRSFEEASSNTFALERSNSQQRGLDRSKSREEGMGNRSLEAAISESPTLEYRNFPESPKILHSSMSFGEPLFDVVQDVSSSKEDEFQSASKPTDASVASSVSSPSVSQSPAKWTRVIPGSTFVEEKHTLVSENFSSTLENTLNIPKYDQRVKHALDQIKLNNVADLDFADGDESTEYISDIVTQSKNSNTYQPLTVSPASPLVRTSLASSAPYSPTESFLQKSMVTSTPVKLEAENISLTYYLNKKKDTADKVEFDFETRDSKRKLDIVKENNKNEGNDFTDYTISDNAEEVRRKVDSREAGDEFQHEEKNEVEKVENSQGRISDKKQHPTPYQIRQMSYSVESTDDLYPEDSSSASGLTSPMTSFDSATVVESVSANTQTQPSKFATPLSFRGSSWAQSQFHSGSPKKPKSMKELKKRYKQPYKSILTQDPTNLNIPKAAPFILPDHLITPSRLKIMQSRNKFLSEQNLHTDYFSGEFEARKETLAQTVVPMKERKYTPKMTRHQNYRSQEQLEKIMYMVNLKPGRSESSLGVDCLHDDCILSEKGRREVLDKTLSIDNLSSDLQTCLRKLSSGTGGASGDAFYPETNSDLFDLTFPFQDELNRYLDRPASMSELRYASKYSTISGSKPEYFDTLGSISQDSFAQKQYKKSKSLCELETAQEDADFADSTNGDLQRPPSAHDLRISKSLQKLNVPNWYKRSSLSKSGTCLPEYSSSNSMAWALSPSVVSSPSTTPSTTSNVVIRSRVLFPTSARNLRSPRFSSKSAPTTPSFVTHSLEDSGTIPTPVKLPSEKMRTMDRPKSLMPIPIVPFDKIRAMIEKKKEASTSKFETGANFASSSSQPSAVIKTIIAKPDTAIPHGSLAISGKDETDRSREVVPEIIVSPTDPNVKSILKRPDSEKKLANIQKPSDADVEKIIRPVPTKLSESTPIITLPRIPVSVSSHKPLKQHTDFRHTPQENPVPAERPKSIELNRVEQNVKDSKPFETFKQERAFSEQQKEEEMQSPVAKPRGFLKSRVSSTISSQEEIKYKKNKFQDKKGHMSAESSLDSPDYFAALPGVGQSPMATKSPPTIIITSDSSRSQESLYVNVTPILTKPTVTMLEGVPVARPPDQKPFIATVIEDRTVSDPETFYMQERTSWTSRSPESVYETDLNSPSSESETITTKPAKEEPEHGKRRSWVPKPKSKRMKSPEAPKTSQLESRHWKTSVSESQELVDESLRLQSPTESESHEGTLTPEEVRADFSLNNRNESPVNFFQDSRTVTKDADFDLSHDSYTSRSPDGSDESSHDYINVSRVLERNVSNPSFTRDLDRVLDHLSSPNVDRPNSPSKSDSDESTPTHESNRRRNSTKERKHGSFDNTTTSTVRKSDVHRDLERWDTKEYDIRNLSYDKSDENYDRNDNDYDWSDGHYDRKGKNYDRASQSYDRPEGNYDRRDMNYEIPSKNYDIREDDYPDRDYDINVDHNRREIMYDKMMGYSRKESDNDNRNVDYNMTNRVYDKADIHWQQDPDSTTREGSEYSVGSNRQEVGLDRSSVSRDSDRESIVSMNSQSKRPLSDTYEEPIVSKPSVSRGRTWQPKPRKNRGFDSSPPKRATAGGDDKIETYDPSLDSNKTSNTSPYKYKVAGSAFNSTRPGILAGLITPPSGRRESQPASISPTSEQASRSPKETTV